MSSKRIEQRCPSARFVSVAYLKDYCLKFNKASKKGGVNAKANIMPSKGNVVWGVVFAINENEKIDLDNAEGLGQGYDELTLDVVDEHAENLKVRAYVAQDQKFLSNAMLPFDWYKEHCLRGAREFKLPAQYVKQLDKVDSIPGPRNLRASELSIYNMIDESAYVQSTARKLLGQVPLDFKSKGVIAVTNRFAVYVIYDANLRVLYVGKNNRGNKGLNQRLADHLYGRSSFAKNYLKDSSNKLPRTCKLQYIVIMDDRIRTLVEAWLIGTLCPAYVGTGASRM